MEEEKKLKMKFKLHQLEFELEGNQEIVKEQFENFKSFVIIDLLPKINVKENTAASHSIEQSATKQIQQAEEVTQFEICDIPNLKDIKLRDLAKSESDWMIVYSYLASDGGKRTFTRSNIIQLYKDSDRYSEKIVNGLSQYLKNLAKADLIKATSDLDFIILDRGKEKANQIFQGKSSSKKLKAIGTNKTVAKTKTKPKERSIGNQKFEFNLDKNLNLRPDGKESLRAFAAKYDLDSTPKQITLIVYYLKNKLGIEAVNGDHIYTGLDELGVRIPPSLKQIITNTKGRRNGWLDYKSMQDISLSIKGTNAIKHDLLKA